MNRRSILIAAGIVASVTVTSFACNIPVFRYALERWRADKLDIVVLHDKPLSSQHSQWLDQFAQRSEQGSANANVNLASVGELSDANQNLYNVLRETSNFELPYLVIRGQHLRGPFNTWHGSVSAAMQTKLLDSPARRELGRRLLAGDAVIWLVIQSTDSAKNTSLRKSLEKQCETLGSKVELPEGIGLPGSELFSEVPLLLNFSVLEIDRSDRDETVLVNLGRGFQPEAFAANEPLVIPVFGRGRALEVIPASQLSERLVEDLTLFLCGACSCQVKEQNPGFDLLLSVDWQPELFGEDGAQPPDSPAGTQREKERILLTIPPGRKKPSSANK